MTSFKFLGELMHKLNILKKAHLHVKFIQYKCENPILFTTQCAHYTENCTDHKK